MTFEPQPTASPMLSRLRGIRIARISTVPFFVVAQLKYQIALLGQQGAQVTVITSNDPELSQLKNLTGVRCVPIDIPRAISPYRDLLALLHLFMFFKRHRVQIAHSTTPKAGLLTALAAFLARVPVRLHTFTGQPWLTMHGGQRWLARMSDQLIGKINTRCYTDSPSQRQFLVAQQVLKAERLFVIGSGSLAGVDMQRFDRNRFSEFECDSILKSLSIPAGTPILLFLGRITIDKGIRELLQAFRILKENGSNAHLILAGRFDKDSGIVGEISPTDVQQIPDTHIIGHTDRPETFLAVADILCLPSYREGFGTVAIEAASMGIPVVGTNIYGLSDAVVHDKTGILVPTHNVEALVAAIDKLLSNKPLRMELGSAARKRAREKFEAESFNRLVIDEYSTLLEQARVELLNERYKPKRGLD